MASDDGARGVPIRLTLLTGFLGAGKTTLLNRLIGDPALGDAAVVVNEFGEAAIDPLLIEAVSSDGVISLSNGCLCCTVRGELVDTLADLAAGAGATEGRRPPARVLVETTGLADPGPILSAIMAHPFLSHAYALDGVVTVVDAAHGLATLAAHEESRRQIAVADRIVLTKADLVSADAVASLHAAVRRINPRAPIVDAATVTGAEGVLVGCGLADSLSRGEGLSNWLGEPLRSGPLPGGAPRNAPRDQQACPSEADGAGDDCSDHAGHRHHGHDHDHFRHDAIRSISLETDRPVPFDAIASFLEILTETAGGKILRMKGVVLLAENPARPLVIHGVQGFMHPPAQLPAWPRGAAAKTLIVLIGSGLDERYARDLFGAFTGGIAPDAADRAAIEANPLAVPGHRFEA
ncbi:CobW family GTP-binding protein [Jiella sonneratiae]|uniref:GTP-binding protein n=1 Tax=Jiella sonneratiae TaxID=2816856 RepID=A0ABS3J5D9_9HYPH|nr:GTP-binding protein [Jiella sonneratiae]MBO0904890.1 GTP-binding protein [Jiella sonneratiae]